VNVDHVVSFLSRRDQPEAGVYVEVDGEQRNILVISYTEDDDGNAWFVFTAGC